MLNSIFEKIGYIVSAVTLVVGIIEVYGHFASKKAKYEFEIDAVKHSSKTGWLDTEINISLQKEYEIKATGYITLGEGYSQNGPDGHVRSEKANCQSFECGQLVGRLGATGKTIGLGRDATVSNESGRLYLSIWDSYPTNNTGKYKVEILVKK